MAVTTARKSAIHELANQGQSLWLDNLRRPLITSVGALKDVVQNHLQQVVALLAMEPPVGVDAERLRDEKVKVFRAIPAIDPSQVVRGQYLGHQQEEGSTPSWSTLARCIGMEPGSWGREEASALSGAHEAGTTLSYHHQTRGQRECGHESVRTARGRDAGRPRRTIGNTERNRWRCHQRRAVPGRRRR